MRCVAALAAIVLLASCGGEPEQNGNPKPGNNEGSECTQVNGVADLE